ncbi:RAMP superfamily CRISPR-associated protein [Desulfonatronovibrio magnus]|uniref:RAMP superfamily CRISPR-associated protein n=1 Tax=Desulfonatronovibrio magnus TaxID=698827 RepID=UPI0005EAEAAC|nr:RAMP superfamily CRISPR-associated protein [Desulfonatronovibrio magnus]
MKNYIDDMSPNFNARSLSGRLEVKAVLELTSPAHLGGVTSHSLSDHAILIDHQGRPYLPGTTLTGLLRHHMHKLMHNDHHKPLGVTELDDIADLFGSRWDVESDDQSSIIVDDAFFDSDQAVKTELRDGVAISCRTGSAIPGKKFDREWLAVGSRFYLSFELLLCNDNEKCKNRLKWFSVLLQALEEEQVSVGARSSRGFGRCRAKDFAYRLFDTGSMTGMLQWLGAGGGLPDSWPNLEYKKAATVKDMFSELNKTLGMSTNELSTSRVPCLNVQIKMSCPGSMLIKSSMNQPDNADSIHIHRLHQNSSFVPVIPGTSMAGILRHRALKISNTIAGESNRYLAEQLIDSLFGPEIKPGQGKVPKSSRIIVEEAVLQGEPELINHARVMIDRWQGGAFKHNLFDALVLFGSSVTIKWKVENPLPADHELGLMLCLVKDLFTGNLLVGAETGVGRGVLYGIAATVSIQGSSPHLIQLKGDARGSLEIAESEKDVNPYFTALRNYLQGEAK